MKKRNNIARAVKKIQPRIISSKKKYNRKKRNENSDSRL